MSDVVVVIPPTNLSLIEEQESLLVIDEETYSDLVSTSCEGSSFDSNSVNGDETHAVSKPLLDTSNVTACTSPISVLEDSGVVNTQTSILNITEEEDEDEEADVDNVIICVDDHVIGEGEFAPADCDTSSVMFETDVAVKASKTLVDDMMEHFVDKMCVAPKLNDPLNLCPANELNVISTPPPPRRRTIKMRNKRVSELLDQRKENAPKFKHIQSLQSMVTASSYDGYDSDPELNPQQPEQHASETDLSYFNVTQNCLNRTWKLKLQTNATYENCDVWMERGTLVRGHHMLEPRLCYRSDPTKQPSSIKLLHICRIRPTTRLDIQDRPFAKLSCCVTIKTVRNEIFVFQSESIEAREAVLYFWKSTVARFASLAVLEDANTLWSEFFVSANSPPPLSTI